MGRLVKLWKAEETDTRVVYLYGPSEAQRGRIACAKADGDISLVEPLPDISEQDDRFFYRDLAMVRLRKLYRSGEFPDEAIMAT
jgi:hypothetical protein